MKIYTIVLLAMISWLNTFSQNVYEIEKQKYFDLKKSEEILDCEKNIGYKLNSLYACFETTEYLDTIWEDKLLNQTLNILKERVKELATKHYENDYGLILSLGGDGHCGRYGEWFDELTQKYGFKYLSINCDCDAGYKRDLQEAYNNLAYQYLYKKNGKNWEYKLENDIVEKKRIVRFDLNEIELLNLKKLSLHNRELINYPNEIEKLINIELLDLGYNNLVNIDENICKLKKLEKLELNSNNFTVFPKEVLCLTSLKELNLSKNKLDALSNEVGSLKNLVRLDFGYNKIKNLPKGFSELKKLKVLILSNNKLRSIPDCIYNMDNLEILIIENGNRISQRKINKLKEFLPNTTIK